MEPQSDSAGSKPQSNEDVGRKGSVKRAREMLQAGKRPERVEPEPPFRVNPAHMTQWPLPDNTPLPSNLAHPQATLSVLKGPPPVRPPRPDCPSPSVYSERSMSDVPSAPSPLNIKRPVPSFSQPFPLQQGPRPTIRIPIPRPPSPDSVAGSTPRISVATDDLFRQSGISTVSSITELPSVPQPLPLQHRPAPGGAPKKAASLAPPVPVARPGGNRASSVSPIPEELPDSPTISQDHYGTAQPYPPSWYSGQAESEILGTYLDGESDDDDSVHTAHAGIATLLRQASIGTRGKPSLRTIQKSNASSPVPPSERTPVSARPTTAGTMLPEVALKEVSVGSDRRDSVSSTSTSSSHFNLEKAPIILDISTQHPALARPYNDNEALQKEVGALPKAAPTMSDKRPGGRRPPRLNMLAVRDAEARGSLTSLPDLILRATKLASNLEHGRTASRNDLLNGGGGSRFPFHDAKRKSGSIKSILASFPPPAATPEGGHSSWPFFLRRSTLHQIQSNEPPQGDQEKAAPRQPRRCCGLPPWLFGLICVLIIIIILAAILIPVCLLVLRHKSNGTDCATSNPCENGGVSVSSGSLCSCVCANGYTGSRCTISGDASCVTTQVDNKNATMGSNLPRLFEYSQQNYSISLDAVTIMALFSQSNVSCTTENTLVSFAGVATSSSKARRALSASPLTEPLISDYLLANLEPPSSTLSKLTPTQVLAARDSVATSHGIVFDDDPPTTVSATATATNTGHASQATETSTSNSTTTAVGSSSSNSTAVTTEVLDFARVAVLYILEETGTLAAAEFSESNIQSYLTEDYTDAKTHSFTIDLTPSGILGNYTLDFDDYKIKLPSGSVVGGG
ncbi:hypothetical protein BO94DRAFT_169820 [Aspergillus sclerotioniger CBS 115572]|uniref:EGF-like domain-containing protein n=1 Tax=Aspergillus sclerotioniger CBS 115572 TaxID=1450535 RepID=A0A317W5M1_9EURO|nr:hypothetical protein BO94DRAFT_169820 [Aspergillus sclerotioniger CBS 115572]PWY79450.1 hypothetical protein BO94DRAFT_169820 [Aspergillus sclerotioniger CBS 115572]